MANSVQTTAHTTPTSAIDAPAQANSASATQKHAKTSAPPASSVPKDTVKISNAAQTALQESQETRAQTAKEAASGDRQAAQVQAKESKIK
jgi:hypothetical protein